MLFIDAKEQVLRKIDRTSGSQSGSNTSMSPQARNGKASMALLENYTILLTSPSDSAMREDHFITHLVANLNGPMEIMCRTLLPSCYQEGLPQQTARRQSFLALATTFYGLGEGQEKLMNDGRLSYLRALKMINMTINAPGAQVRETLSSVVALCLHEVR
jgi:hypothetical protein